MDNQPKVYIKSYGCQMNVYDTERMYDLMFAKGYTTTDSAENADLLVLNTCHIREKAAEKIYSELGRIRQLKDKKRAEKKRLIVAIAGCVAQAEGRAMFERAPIIDILVGPQNYHILPDLIDRYDNGERHLIETEFNINEKFNRLKETSQIQSYTCSSFLSIQEGCDKFCTFCVVPYTRGAEYSRPVEEIVQEATLLAHKGVKEITLLGQNVNAYHGEDKNGRNISLAQLLNRLIDTVPEISRWRYTTSHPKDMTQELIDAHGQQKKLMPWLHLPIQSGSDSILKAMNRKHNVAQYIDIIERLRTQCPHIGLSSDFIVGFPGETDADFQDTLKLVNTIEYAQAYSFKYSSRPGTPAAEHDNHVPENIKQERLQILQNLLNTQQFNFNTSKNNTVVDVLFEKPGRREGQISGRSAYMQMVNVNANHKYIGTVQKVFIDTVNANSLGGTLVSEALHLQNEYTHNQNISS